MRAEQDAAQRPQQGRCESAESSRSMRQQREHDECEAQWRREGLRLQRPAEHEHHAESDDGFQGSIYYEDDDWESKNDWY